MNLILVGFHRVSQLDIINRLVERFDFKYICHVSSKKVSITPGGKDVIIDKRDMADLVHWSMYGGYDLSDCEPLDDLILEKMAPYESTILRLMDRLEVISYSKYSRYKVRYELYLKYVRYWNDLIKKKKIDLYITTHIPHTLYDYVIFSLCKVYGIPTLSFSQTQMAETTIPIFDIKNWREIMGMEYTRLVDYYKDQNSEGVRLSGMALVEWDERRGSIVAFIVPPYSFYRRALNFLYDKALVKSFFIPFNPFKLFKLAFAVIAQECKDTLLKFVYSTVSSPPDFTKRYVYFPLHLQPELSTCPVGGYMVNQALAVEMLAKTLPPDVMLYVKENPNQKYNCRNFKYYHNILRSTKNIIFVPLNTDTHKLSDNAIAVATITGTAGWEALFKQRPVIIFGDWFYDSAPGVFKIRTVENCREAVNAIMKGQFVYEEKKLKIFLQAVSNCSIHCTSDEDYFAVSKFTIEENNNRMVAFLERFLNEFNKNRLVANNQSVRAICGRAE